MTDELRYLKRNRFFIGRLLTAEDLEFEQDYFRDKLKRHNRYLHGFGVVFGLEVSSSSDKIQVSTGLALDCTGNEIVIPEPLRLSLPPLKDLGTSIFLTLRYTECDEGEASGEKLRITECVQASFESENSNAGHRHLKGRWLSCGKSHPLTIARIKLTTGHWRIDRHYHPPAIK